MSFDLLFPTAVLNDCIENFDPINIALLEHIRGIQKTVPAGGSNWLGKPYNTCGTHNITNDPAFNVITERVTKVVHKYASRLGININRNKFTATEGWLNIYSQQDFQEFHYHSGFVFSAVYYVQAPENSSEIIFESPLPPDMNPLPVMLHSGLTDERARYKVSPGQVIVFRSNLRHCVPAHTGAEDRISLAFNFK